MKDVHGLQCFLSTQSEKSGSVLFILCLQQQILLRSAFSKQNSVISLEEWVLVLKLFTTATRKLRVNALRFWRSQRRLQADPHFSLCSPSLWPGGKTSASRATDLGSIPLFAVDPAHRALWSECPSEEDWHFRHFPVWVRTSWPNPRPRPSVLPKVCRETSANMATGCWSGDQAVGLGRRPLPDGWFCGINRTEDLTCTAVDRWRRRRRRSRGSFSGSSRTMTWTLVLQWLPCKAPGVTGSALGLAGPVSVYCGWPKL